MTPRQIVNFLRRTICQLDFRMTGASHSSRQHDLGYAFRIHSRRNPIDVLAGQETITVAIPKRIAGSFYRYTHARMSVTESVQLFVPGQSIKISANVRSGFIVVKLTRPTPQQLLFLARLITGVLAEQRV
jgi:hypothetical protein